MRGRIALAASATVEPEPTGLPESVKVANANGKHTQAGFLYVDRLKNGTPSNQPIRGPEIRALRRLQRESPETPYVFVTERKEPLTASTVRKLVARAGTQAKLPFPVHPHLLRHAGGYKLSRDGHDTRAVQRMKIPATNEANTPHIPN
jgi:integrase